MTKKSNSRSFARLTLRDLHVQVVALQSDKPDQEVIIDNISLGGVSITCQKDFTAGEELLLSLNKTKNQFIRAKIKWCEPFNKQHRAGLEFLVHDGNEKEVVTDFIHTLLNMLTKEKIISRTLDMFCCSITKQSHFKTFGLKFMGFFKKKSAS